MSAICHVLRPSHQNQRGSTLSELQSLRFFSPFFIQRSLDVVYQLSHVTTWATEIWILTYCLSYLDFSFLTAYTYFPTSDSGYFPPLIYFRISRLGCLLLRGDILTFSESPSMSCITFINSLTTLPTTVALLLLFAMYRITKHIFRVLLIVTCRPVLLELSEVLSGVIWCDRMRN